jgi:dipeptidyl aminopeptidase/acylaminoacyl peptidase
MCLNRTGQLSDFRRSRAYAESKNMAAKLKEVGVEHEFLTVAGAGHGLKGGKPEEVAQVADRAVAFVRTHTK